MAVFRQRSLLAVAALSLLLGSVGCGPDTISESEAREYVDNWAKRADESLEQQVSVASERERFENIAKKSGERASNDVGRTEPPYDSFVRQVYSTVGWKLRLASADGFTERGSAVWNILSKADRHALETGPFDFKAIQKTRDRIEKLDAEIADVASYEPTKAEKRAAREWLVGKKVSDFALDSENDSRLVDALVETDAGSQLADRMERVERLYGKRANAIAKLELLLARNAARYARKMKHFRIRHVFIHEREDDYWRNPEIEEERPDKAKGPYVAGTVWRQAAKVADAMKDPTKILHRRIRKTLRKTLTEENPKRVLEELQPDHPQYAKLKKVLERYRGIVEDGGWKEVEKEPYLDPGDSGETVAALKKRLQVEGYYPEDAAIDETYDETLEKAVEAYQETHQMEVTGEPHDVFWTSISKSARWRMRQVELNLQRWRESNVRHSDPIYALVNIPGMHLELWRDQERTMRFRVVVGNDDSRYDKEKKKTVHPNHTPEVSAYIDRVIYNPYWNITDRIRKTEILPQVRQSVEQTYKARLRELRAEKRRLEGADSSSSDDSSAEESQFKLLVARGPERTGSGSQGSTSSTGTSEDTENSSSEPSGSGTSDSSGTDTDASAQGSNDKKQKGENSEETKKEVKIDDLYRMVDVEPRIKKVDKKTVFDVQNIRNLLEEVRRLSEKSGEKTGMASSESGTSGGAEKSADSTSSEGGDADEKPKTPLEKKFPYLDPKTGLVDVSTTDPDNVPKWYEQEGYEVMFPGKKWEYVRMKQGQSNALGRVKVIFPNRHSIYLHDTPKKQLFSRNVRAFSHGCMRMNKPLEFAKRLLQKDGLYSDIDIDSLLNDKKKVRAEDDPDKKWKYKYEYRPVFLEKQVPVHVEYFTVRVDDEGRPHFYADIYDKDEKRLKEAKN